MLSVLQTRKLARLFHLYTEEFFHSDDPKAPGNWLVGPY